VNVTCIYSFNWFRLMLREVKDNLSNAHVTRDSICAAARGISVQRQGRSRSSMLASPESSSGYNKHQICAYLQQFSR